jgi:UDP-glucose 4-epimerase
MNTILVTGGAGYIGSHTCVELLDAGHQVIVLDNLSNSCEVSVRRVESLCGRPLHFIEADLLDKAALARAFEQHRPDCVIHFAGLKAVGESVEKPLLYYRNNVAGTVNLLEAMNHANCFNMVFSSSCTVYGTPGPDELPLTEDAPLGAISPYGQTKLTIEHMLRDVQRANSDWNVSILRYFNPVGAHPSGRIGEDPLGTPENLMPFITQLAVGKHRCLRVWGDDYPTPDGTCIRDYIHVVDLARGHLHAMKKLREKPGVMIHNLGTGQGSSVLEVIEAFRQGSGRDIPYRIEARRPGDVTAVYADPALAEKELGWKAQLSLLDMCRDAFNWQTRNPQGYRAGKGTSRSQTRTGV